MATTIPMMNKEFFVKILGGKEPSFDVYAEVTE